MGNPYGNEPNEGGQGGYPGYSPPPPPPKKSRAPLYAALAIATVVIGAAAVAIPLFLLNKDRKDQVEPPPPTVSANALLLSESAFQLDGAKFNAYDGDEEEDPGVSTDPKDCERLARFIRPEGAEYAYGDWTVDEDLPSVMVYVETWADDGLDGQANFIADSCKTFKTSYDDGSEPADVKASAFEVDGADATATGSRFVNDDLETDWHWYESVVRGTTVRVGYGVKKGDWTDANGRDAVELLNEQIKKVRDAQ